MTPMPTGERRSRVSRKMRVAWDPTPLPVPQLATDIKSMAALERVAEILRYRLLRAEYALSPNGALRAWLKLCLKIALIVGTPALILGPILMLILSGIAAMAEALVRICVSILKAVVTVIAIVLMIVAFAASRRRQSK